MRRSLQLVALAFATSALLAGTTAGARGYTRCVKCGTVVDVDPIVFDETDANRGAADGAVLAGVMGSRPDTGRQSGTIADVAVDGLTGRLVNRNYTGPGTPGTRLEVKLDTGGHNIVEVKGRVRIYRDDRVRLEGGKIALNY